ncbi:ester cyclase [Streptomyces sp. C10-9-1]|uniref:ester cyclase n=1 Tax=Streptomyces sp. C10-9-1 TaxID=1859285 RepID=UPI0021136CB3|nr:ester cyclase [Streptomyces sp. C10-9-1]MCQ6551669.1 ester cyclase [Streptomyces sp. C10-9-1]
MERTPQQHADHVRWMPDAYGSFPLTVDELIAEDDRVYARWARTGRHGGRIGPHPPTDAELTETASAVHRVEDRPIAGYRIRIDRRGTTARRERTAASG